MDWSTLTNSPTSIGKTDAPVHSRDNSDNSSQAVVDKGDSPRKDMWGGNTDENRSGSTLGGDDSDDGLR